MLVLPCWYVPKHEVAFVALSCRPFWNYSTPTIQRPFFDKVGRCHSSCPHFSYSSHSCLFLCSSLYHTTCISFQAAVGWPISELLDRKIALYFGLDTLLDAYDRAPSLLNGGLERVSPVWWGTCLGMTAAIDLDGIAKARAGDPEYFPGKYDFDPLNLYPKDAAGRARMQLGTFLSATSIHSFFGEGMTDLLGTNKISLTRWIRRIVLLQPKSNTDVWP